MLLDPKTGYLYLLYFDQQNYLAPERADIYVAISYNGGLKFDQYKLNKEPVKLDQDFPPDTRMHLSSQGWPEACWAAADLKGNGIYFKTQIVAADLKAYNKKMSIEALSPEKSVPFADSTKITFTSSRAMNYSAVITKPVEPAFGSVVVVRDARCRPGKNELCIDTKALKLEKDTYVISFYYEHKNTFAWITAE
jgi:hypothetical protein